MLLALIRWISLVYIALLMVGCAEWGSGTKETPTPAYNDPYTQSDLNELLGFGANMANTPPASRAELCQALLDRQKSSPQIGLQLHLMVGRLLSDACGDIGAIISGVAAIPTASLADEQVRRLVAIDLEALKRLGSVSRKISNLDRKQKNVQSVLESKPPKTPKVEGNKMESNKDEARLLREKLEAIRSMEKQMDENGGN